MKKSYTVRLTWTLLCLTLFNAGCAIDANMNELLAQQATQITLSEASAPYTKSSSSVHYTVTYQGYKNVTLQGSDIILNGTDTTGCVATVTGTGNVRDVEISGCTGNGPVTMSLGPDTAKDVIIVNFQGQERGTASKVQGVSSAKPVIVDNTASELSFASTSLSFDKDAGLVSIPVLSSVAKNYDYAEKIVVPSLDNTVSTVDYDTDGVVKIPAGATTGSLSLTLHRHSSTIGDQILKLRLTSSLLVPNGGDSPKSAFLQIRLVDSTSNLAASTIIRTFNSACIVLTGGELRCWGMNTSGQVGDGTTLPRSAPVQVIASGVQSVTMAGSSLCAILTGGELRCWGDNSGGQLGDGTKVNKLVPTQIIATGVQSVFMMSGNSCAILTGGELRCWGYNSYGQVGDGTTVEKLVPTQIFASGVQSITAGPWAFSFCAILTGGVLKCWGYNGVGQLGDTSTTNRLAPVQIIATGVQSVSLLNQGACAILTGGELRCWGGNTYGQVGDGTTVAKKVPTQIFASGVQSVLVNDNTTCALLTGGLLKCWGQNTNGQVGDGTTVNKSSPTQVIASGVQSIATGNTGSSFCALLTGGVLKCWGTNTGGQLGDGTLVNKSSPTQIIASGVQSLWLSSNLDCVIMTDASIKCWGNNSYGQANPVSSVNTQTSPNAILNSGVSSLALGSGNMACALLVGGKVKCWGAGDYYLLGDTNSKTPRALVSNAAASAKPLQLESTAGRSCGLWAGGSLRCWGNNYYGGVGDGTTLNRVAPVQIIAQGVAQFSVGYSHTCAVLTSGAMKCWGSNSLGELGDGTTVAKSLPVSIFTSGVKKVAAGANYTCVILTTGELKCWGTNFSGQVGDGTTVNKTVPTSIIASGVKDVSMGGKEAMTNSHTCALLDTGALKCWGNNSSNELGDGTGTGRTLPTQIIASGVESFSLGIGYSCAVLTGGELRCWGQNGNGNLGDNTTVAKTTPTQIIASGVKKVSAKSTTCALFLTGEVKCWGYNATGSVGDGTYVGKLVPTSALASGATDIAVGSNTVYAILATGEIWGWGNSEMQPVYPIYDIPF